MGLLTWLFGNKRTTVGNTHNNAGGQPRGISYDPALIDRLKTDHEDLVALYVKLGALLEAGKYGDIRSELINFKTRFEAHILTENVRFYVYLEQHMHDAHNLDLMRDFRREMNTIARGVVEFVKKYQFAAFDGELRSQFMQDYQTVGGLLTHRIEREENSLYPLYHRA